MPSNDAIFSSCVPDNIAADEIYPGFLKAIEGYEVAALNTDTLLDLFTQLSDRQWHTYTSLSNEQKKKIESFLMSIWDGRNLKWVEAMIVITAHLGLVDLFSFICSRSNDSLSPEVIAEIKSAVSELGHSISDPFSGMK
ncbi:hypothetical protein [Pseudomonas tolaasii]|uniref:hypothetical protein n=1 Tax=Pseudomonas tolaasii TaxID=29442 RepID=UPI00036906B7|nr:hypothetical protein [Pseudomonas tolaasii]